MRSAKNSIAPPPSVSLILITYNSLALLPAFFESLAATRHPDYEVIVADNASADATLAYLAEAQPQARVLPSPVNEGFGRACNRGARVARGDLLVFLNPDVTFTPGWLGTLAARAAEHPEAAIISPTTLDPAGPEARDLRLASSPPAQAPVRETAAVPGCAMLVRRAAWEELGGFDEQIFMYWEDTELCWRAWLLGWRVLVDMEATVFHERGGSGGGRRWESEAARNALYTHLKLMRWRRALPFAARLALVSLVRLALGRRWGDVAGAWAWNLRCLGLTLARRRALLARRRGDPARLEALIDAHTREQRRRIGRIARL